MLRFAIWLTVFGLIGMPLAGCGDDDTKKVASTVVEEPEPQDAVAEIKLQLEDFRQYYYCDRTYPQTCDDLPTAYVLPRESGPFEVVFYNNVARTDGWAIFDYLTVDLDTDEIDVVGQFQWREILGEVERKGEPVWGIPE